MPFFGRFCPIWPRATWTTLNYTPWTSTCWSALLNHSSRPEDTTLACLARNVYIGQEASRVSKRSQGDDREPQLLLLGLEAQLRDWQSKIPSDIATSAPVLLSALFAEILIHCSVLMTFPAQRASCRPLKPDADKVSHAIPLVRRFFEIAAQLDHGHFSALEWAKLVSCVILGTKLSFPLKEISGWDYMQARSELKFREYLEQICGGGDAAEQSAPQEGSPITRPTDIKCASRAILNVVLRKYNDKIERERKSDEPGRLGCPMLDGSADEYLYMWDDNTPMLMPAIGDQADVVSLALHMGSGAEAFNDRERAPRPSHGAAAQVDPRIMYHDLWATMTLGWGERGLDSLG